MSKVLKIVAVVAAIAVNFIPGVGQVVSAAITSALGTGAVATTLATIATAMITAGGLAAATSLFGPKPPNLSAQEAVNRLNVSLDPDRPANIVWGETALATALSYAETEASKKEWITQVFAGAGHQIHSFGETWLDDEMAINGAGAVQSGWSGVVSRLAALGTEDQAALSIAHSTYPSSAHFFGIPTYSLLYNATKEKLSTGLPQRLTQKGEGALFYDPRLDSTRGGVGLHRTDDQTTWEFYNGGDLIGDNPVLMGLWYLLGWKKNGKHAIGAAVNPDNINWDSVISSANVSDELVNGKKRYFGGGIDLADGDHARVLNTLEVSFGLKINKDAAGIYHFWIPHNDLISTHTITDEDIVGPVQYDPGGIEGLYNIGRGQFPDPEALYQLRPIPEVREAAYVVEDGRDRVFERDLPLIQDAEPGQRVLRYHVRRSRYGDTWQVPVKFTYLGVKYFEIITLNCEETAGVDQLCRVMKIDISVKGVIVLTVIEEHAEIYDDTTPPVPMPPALSAPGFDAGYKHSVVNLDTAATSIAGSGGSATDVLKITWDDPGGAVKRTDIEYRKNGTTDWQTAAPARINDTEYLIIGVLSSTLYDVRARHVSITNVEGDWFTTTQTAGNDTAIDYGSVSNGPPVDATAQFAPDRAWDFRNSDHGFSVQDITVQLWPTYIRLASTSSDPIFTKSGLDINGLENSIIRVRLKRTNGTAWDGTIFYGTGGHGISGSYKKTVADPTTLYEWVVVEWDMSDLDVGGTDWQDSAILSIRFDFGKSASDIFEVDWIAVGRISSLATVGAQAGIDFLNEGGSVIGDSEVLNENTTPADIGYTGNLEATKNYVGREYEETSTVQNLTYNVFVDCITAVYSEDNVNRVFASATFTVYSALDCELQAFVSVSPGGAQVHTFSLIAGQTQTFSFRSQQRPDLGSLDNTHTLVIKNTTSGVTPVFQSGNLLIEELS